MADVPIRTAQHTDNRRNVDKVFLAILAATSTIGQLPRRGPPWRTGNGSDLMKVAVRAVDVY